jgi:hypothetical protein
MENQPDSNGLEHTGETFYPSFLFKEIVVMMCVFILVAIILSLVFPVGLAILPTQQTTSSSRSRNGILCPSISS